MRTTRYAVPFWNKQILRPCNSTNILLFLSVFRQVLRCFQSSKAHKHVCFWCSLLRLRFIESKFLSYKDNQVIVPKFCNSATDQELKLPQLSLQAIASSPSNIHAFTLLLWGLEGVSYKPSTKMMFLFPTEIESQSFASLLSVPNCSYIFPSSI
jgi:hypothetical protein